MSQSKQAKILSPKQVAIVLRHLETTRYPSRNKLIFLLSVRAGLRVKEIASLTWSMVTDSGGDISHCIALEDKASKGKSGRIIPLHKDLGEVLTQYRGKLSPPSHSHIITSERGAKLSPKGLAVWFLRLYKEIGFDGCSSHSGRRTFITSAAKKIVEAGGSIRDVQQLAGHTSLNMTQRYIEGDSEAKRRVIDLM